jgi:hypothetical protein
MMVVLRPGIRPRKNMKSRENGAARQSVSTRGADYSAAPFTHPSRHDAFTHLHTGIRAHYICGKCRFPAFLQQLGQPNLRSSDPPTRFRIVSHGAAMSKKPAARRAHITSGASRWTESAVKKASPWSKVRYFGLVPGFIGRKLGLSAGGNQGQVQALNRFWLPISAFDHEKC